VVVVDFGRFVFAVVTLVQSNCRDVGLFSDPVDDHSRG
jgi:hypothetical protein